MNEDYFLDWPPPPPLTLERETCLIFLGTITRLNRDLNQTLVRKENGELELIYYEQEDDWEIGDDMYYSIRGDETMYYSIRGEETIYLNIRPETE